MTSEADTRANYIDPALASSGWQSSQIVREYYFTDGRKLAGGQRGTRYFGFKLQVRGVSRTRKLRISTHPMECCAVRC